MAANPSKRSRSTARTLDALPDTIDFRDTLFVPTLIHVPAVSDLKAYRDFQIPVLDQGSEGACTGFGLATVANYLLRVRGRDAEADPVSAWMLYTMAKRYDEWPGEDYDGSSARGAMKGWFKHGLCAYALWREKDPDPTDEDKRSADALGRPLGAYFRVNHNDLVAMHSAINEAGILYATARVHTGWQDVRPGDEAIVHRPGQIGGHAFAIVGYDREGFWIQNSWGPGWGAGGLARLSYPDWLANGSDVWVAALGAPVDLRGQAAAVAQMRAGAPRAYESRTYANLRPHVVTARNDGLLDDKGTFGLTEKGLESVIVEGIPKMTAAWKTKRVLLCAHGGLVSQDSAIQTVSNNLADLLASEVYPLSFIWRTDAWTTIRNILGEAIRGRRDEGILDKTKDFMLDRLDDTLEVLARTLGGKALWDEMKENAARATTQAKGAARLAADHLAALYKDGGVHEIHLVGHSAGSILLAPLAGYLARKKVPIRSVSLWAPACTIEMFEKDYAPLVKSGAIEAFDLYLLDDATERDDNCADIYHKSLLYLVRNAFEARPRIPLIQDGVPLLGLERDVKAHIPAGFWKKADNVLHRAPGPASEARHHGDFDNDPATLRSTLRRIVGAKASAVADIAATSRASSPRARRHFRQKLDLALAP